MRDREIFSISSVGLASGLRFHHALDGFREPAFIQRVTLLTDLSAHSLYYEIATGSIRSAGPTCML